MKTKSLAIDLGASNGRVILGEYDGVDLNMSVIHRFNNGPVESDGYLVWDTDYLFQQVIEGIQLAVSKHKIDSIAVNTWGVDYGLIGHDGRLLHLPRNYRDSRMKKTFEDRKFSFEKLYKQTGNQVMAINTFFQLLADISIDPDLKDKADRLLLMPDLFNYLLTGKKYAERSIASTTQLYNPKKQEWHYSLMEENNIPIHLFPQLVDEGHEVGFLKEEFGLGQIPVVNVCSHDTASAVVSIPSTTDFLFISCGTWSLIGTELEEPIMTEKSYSYNLTNESGINKSTRFLKNLTGLWIIQEVKREFEELGKNYSYSDFEALIAPTEKFKTLIDTEHPMFSTPGNMVEKIQIFATQTNQEVPRLDGEIVRCVYESLTYRYRHTFLEITDTLRKDFDSVYIIGGGSQSALLCQMIADSSKVTLYSGPIEATALGNLLTQFMALEKIESVSEARRLVTKTQEIQKYYPDLIETDEWENNFWKYAEILNQEIKI